MNPIKQILNEFPIMILDGAMATELERHGCNLNDRLWSAKVLLENPELIKRVHTDYFKAGADCAITASYQATIAGYIDSGLSKETAIELMNRSVHIAAEARDEYWCDAKHQHKRPKPLVAASIGPYGAFLADGSEYRGDYSLTEAELITFHRERIGLLVAAGAGILACETIPCLLEAKAITKVLKEFPGVYAWISFSAKDEFHISNGDKIADCAAWLDQREQVAAIGINCSAPAIIESLVTEIKANTDKPIIVYPNLGEVYDAVNKRWLETPDSASFAAHTKHWYEAGAKIIGGCCRTTPEDIEGISAWARGEHIGVDCSK